MLQFLASLLNRSYIERDLRGSIQNVALSSGVDRRRTVRVKYPASGAVGYLPRLFWNEAEVEIQDVSVGGLCVIDAGNLFGETAGQVLEFKLCWQDEEVQQTAEVVGINFDRRHIRFVDPKPALMTKLNNLLEPGYLGTKFYRVLIPEGFKDRVDADEYWLTPLGESIGFYSKDRGEIAAEIYGLGPSIFLLKNGCFVYGDKISDQVDKEVPANQLMDLAVCVANINEPTERINFLLSHLQARLNQKESSSSVLRKVSGG